MAREKQRKFKELAAFPNFFDGSKSMKGIWKRDYFKNDNPLILELGCGKGEYTNNLGKSFPERNFIGIDLKGVRLWAAARMSLQNALANVAFLQINIDNIEDHFEKDEVDEIWIPFPDPYPKPSKWKKRLVSPIFLKRYQSILKKEGLIHLKTDNTGLYKFALRTIELEAFSIIAHTDDLYQSDILDEYNSIPTYFEGIFKEKGERIKYIRFILS